MASIQEPAFYAYAYPEPPGFKAAQIQPAQAFYSPDFGEFILRYDDMRAAERPDEALLAFAAEHLRRRRRAGGLEAIGIGASLSPEDKRDLVLG